MGKTTVELTHEEPSKLELITLASGFGKDVTWVDNQLKYLSRFDLLACLDTSVSESIKSSSIRMAEHLRMFEREEGSRLRYSAALGFHGSCWLKLDKFSDKRPNEDLNTLILLEGSKKVGWIIPPKVVLSAKRGEEGARRPAEPVVFDLLKRRRNGSPMYILFEGDENQNQKSSPINDLCALLGVQIKDVRRSVNDLVLKTKDEIWTPLNYRENKFHLGFTVDKSIKERIIDSGIQAAVDTIIRENKSN